MLTLLHTYCIPETYSLLFNSLPRWNKHPLLRFCQKLIAVHHGIIVHPKLCSQKNVFRPRGCLRQPIPVFEISWFLDYCFNERQKDRDGYFWYHYIMVPLFAHRTFKSIVKTPFFPCIPPICCHLLDLSRHAHIAH